MALIALTSLSWDLCRCPLTPLLIHQHKSCVQAQSLVDLCCRCACFQPCSFSRVWALDTWCSITSSSVPSHVVCCSWVDLVQPCASKHSDVSWFGGLFCLCVLGVGGLSSVHLHSDVFNLGLGMLVGLHRRKCYGIEKVNLVEDRIS